MADKRWDIDLYRDGACVYQVDRFGNIVSTVAWARNQLAARAAFDEIVARDPSGSYELRNRSWVLAEHHQPDHVYPGAVEAKGEPSDPDRPSSPSRPLP